MPFNPFPAVLTTVPLIAAPLAGASIVYNHYVTNTTSVAIAHDYQTIPPETSSSMEVPGGNENSSQVAQRLTLSGTDRFITRIDMGLIAFFMPCTTDMTAYLYTDQAGLPGSLLWSGSVTGVTLTPSANTVIPVSFTPNIFIPDTVFLAFSHENIINQRHLMGTAIGSPSSGVGLPGFWAEKDTTTGLWSSLGPASFDISARITAIPSPAAGALLALSLLYPRRRR